MIKNKSFVIRNHSQNLQNLQSSQMHPQPSQVLNTRKNDDVLNEIVDNFNNKITELSTKFESVQSEILADTQDIVQIQTTRIAHLEEQVNELSVNFKLIGDLIKQILQKSTQSQ